VYVYGDEFGGWRRCMIFDCAYKQLGGLLVGVIALLPAGARAQVPCAPIADMVTSAQWEGPLSRRVTLRADEITLAEALARLAEAAGIRFSYSADAVPLERRVCIAYTALPVGSALTHLLRGMALEPVVAGAEHVVLAPARVRSVPNEPPTATSPDVVPLQPVEVRGHPAHAHPSTTAVNTVVIDGRTLAQRGSTTLAEILNGAVPGVWVWNDGGTAGAYGSIRGASSFRAASPKVYIDGIEVANSQLLMRISPATVERIEIIRGPQGAALYGANALSGVVNIVTRRAHANGGSALQYVQSGVGVTESDFAGRATLSQDHAVGIAAGTDTRSVGLNVSIGTFGEYAPGAGAQHVGADAYGRIVGSRSVITATVRFLGERSGTASSPLLPDSLQRAAPALAAPNALIGDLPSMRQYTAGISASFQPSTHWTHSVTAGVDGYSLAEPATDQAVRYDPSSGSELVLGALRATARASSLRHFHAGNVMSGTITLAAEHSLLRQESMLATMPLAAAVRRGDFAGGEPRPQQPVTPVRTTLDQVSSSTGLSAQSQLLWHDRFLVTGGVRLERNGSPVYGGRWVALPMLGGALLARHGDADIRLRTAFGRAVRWPTSPVVTLWQPHHRPVNVTHPPEEQSGVEAGIDVRIGTVAALHVTRFDQVATGVTELSLAAPARNRRGSPLSTAGPSIGTIQNRGWELEASLTRGRLALDGNLSLVDSRVRNLAAGYTGDLRPGDRMLAVPARTASLSASWTEDTWSAAVTAARAANWINYDRLALMTDVAAADTTAPELRAYWRRYHGFTHLSATATRQLGDHFTLTLAGTNLLGLQVGEPDNITVAPGRALSVGLRATF
jgi:outer membrane receptor protein involved in Fe transport